MFFEIELKFMMPISTVIPIGYNWSFWTVVALTPIKYDAVAHTSNFIDILPLQKVSKGKSLPRYYIACKNLLIIPSPNHRCLGYEPNWESLDSRPIPRWYDEAKIGIFMHFGPYAVPGFASEVRTIKFQSE